MPHTTAGPAPAHRHCRPHAPLLMFILSFTWSSSLCSMKGNGVATLAQNKIFPAKQELLLSEITGLPLDAHMQRNRLDVDERVEGSRQCSCSRPSWLARAARPIQVIQMQHLQGIHTYGEGSDARRTARSASATRRELWQRGCYLRKLCLFRRGVVHIFGRKTPHTIIH
jgi:hypothetical protein